MPTTDPVIVPVEVDLSRAQSALSAFGATVQSARQGTGPAAGAAGPGAGTAGAAADTVTLRSLGRELASLQGAIGQLTQTMNRLVTMQAAQPAAPAMVPVPAVPTGPAGGPMRGPGGRFISPNAPGGGGAAPGTPPGAGPGLGALSGIGQQLLGGALGLGGMGLGFGGAFSMVQQWVTEAERNAVESAQNAMLMAGRFGGSFAEDYRTANAAGLAPPRTPWGAMMTPAQRRGGMQTLLEAGVPGAEDPLFMESMGAIGMRATGRPETGIQAAAAGYQTYRTSNVGDLLATLVAIGQQENVSLASMLQQFQGIRGLVESRQGQFQRSDAELTSLANLQGILAGLPGDVGKGEGGVRLADTLMGFGSPGSGDIGEALRMQAYVKQFGRSPFGSVDNRYDYLKWAQSPEAGLATARLTKGQLGERGAALVYSGYGRRPLEPLGRMFEGDLSGNVKGLVPAEEALLGGEGMAGTPGGRVLARQAQRGREFGQWGETNDLIEQLKSLIVSNSEVVVALGLLTGGIGALSTGLAAAGFVRTVAGGGAAAGAGAGAAAGARRLTPWALPAIGAAEAGKDLYDWAFGHDPTNYVDVGAGLTGAAVGGAAGFVLGGPAGAAWGATTGYGVGKGAAQLGGAALEAAGIPLGEIGASGQFGGPLNAPFRGGVGLTSYQPAAEQFGTPGTQVALRTLGREWARRYPGARVGIGDLSVASGARFGKHKSHRRGVDIDIRPARIDKSGGPTRIGSKSYDPGATQELVNVIRQIGGPGTIVGFADPRIKGTQKWGDHLDHLHVRFPERGRPRGGAAAHEGATGTDVDAPSDVPGPLSSVNPETHVFIHLDPSFPGQVTTHGQGALVRRLVG